MTEWTALRFHTYLSHWTCSSVAYVLRYSSHTLFQPTLVSKPLVVWNRSYFLFHFELTLSLQ